MESVKKIKIKNKQFQQTKISFTSFVDYRTYSKTKKYKKNEIKHKWPKCKLCVPKRGQQRTNDEFELHIYIIHIVSLLKRSCHNNKLNKRLIHCIFVSLQWHDIRKSLSFFRSLSFTRKCLTLFWKTNKIGLLELLFLFFFFFSVFIKPPNQ